MENTDILVLVAWLDPQPDREKGATYSCVSTVRKVKSAQNLIGRLILQNYRFNWAYVYDEEHNIEMVTSQLLNELRKGLK